MMNRFSKGFWERMGAKECPFCKTVYMKKDPWDQKTHNKRHSKLRRTMTWGKTQAENNIPVVYQEDDFKILHVNCFSPAHIKNKCTDIVRRGVSECDFGFVLTFYQHENSCLVGIKGHDTVAIMVLNNDESAYRWPWDKDIIRKDAPGVSLPKNSRTVHFYWVNPEYRNKGYSYFLPDYACDMQNAERDDLPIAGPFTEAGGKFFRKFCGENPLVC